MVLHEWCENSKCVYNCTIVHFLHCHDFWLLSGLFLVTASVTFKTLFFMLVLLRRTSFLTTFYGLYFSFNCCTWYKFPSGPLRAASISLSTSKLQLRPLLILTAHTFGTNYLYQTFTILSKGYGHLKINLKVYKVSIYINHSFLFRRIICTNCPQAGFEPPWALRAAKWICCS